MEKRHMIILFVIIVLLNFLIFYRIFTPVIYALLISYLLLPLNDFFEKIFKSRNVASIVTLLIIVIPFVVLIVITLNILVNETVKFLENPDVFLGKISDFEEYLKNLGIGISFSSQITNVIEKIESSIDIETAFDFLKDVSYAILNLLLFIFSTFYFLRDGRDLKKASDTIIPVEIKKVYLKLTKELGKTLQGLFYGYVLTAGIIGILAGVTFYVLGVYFNVSYLVSYSVLLGFLIFLFSLLPILGSPMIYVPIVIVELFSNPILALIILVFGIIVLTYFPAFVLTPYISEKKSKIHPLIILFSFIAGPITFGISGFVLGPLFLCSLVALYKVKK
jgi:predicted PurR-regulated permease PerM